jgi:hypothetical protein
MKFLPIVVLALTTLAFGSTIAQNLDGADTVLANLDRYSKLYVSYRNCAWSDYEDANADGNNNNACGVEGNEDMWYAGLTECVSFERYRN